MLEAGGSRDKTRAPGKPFANGSPGAQRVSSESERWLGSPEEAYSTYADDGRRRQRDVIGENHQPPSACRPGRCAPGGPGSSPSAWSGAAWSWSGWSCGAPPTPSKTSVALPRRYSRALGLPRRGGRTLRHLARSFNSALAASRLLALGAAWLGFGAAGCGASLDATYEADVRFEHCMALDATPAASGRRACWEDWLRLATFGQTRDRLRYAEAQLDGASRAAPPTPSATPSGEAGRPAAQSPQSRCESSCGGGLSACEGACPGRACRRSCSAPYSRCLRSCAR